jgi:sarcosine oxidase
MNAEVIVVGLGAVGSATLYQLARRGVPAIGIDRFSPPHDRGSSHGETRITRQGIGEGEVYTPLAIRSHAIWRELEAATGRDLMLTCGLLALEPGEGGATFHGRRNFAVRSAEAAAAHDVAHEMLDADEIGRRWPQFILAADEHGYFEPGGGLLYPEACIAAQLAQAERLGASIVRETQVTELEETRDGVVAHTDLGAFSGAALVVAAGAWIASLIDLPPGVLALQPQTLHWFVADDPKVYGADRFPTFIRSPSAYGVPIAPGAATRAVKIGVETFRTVERPEARGEVGPDDAKRAYDEAVAGRLAGLSRRVMKSAVCVYTVTPDGDFAIGRAPGRPRTLFASACSGHGFKHSAAIGEILATAAADGDDTVIPAAFSVERFA